MSVVACADSGRARPDGGTLAEMDADRVDTSTDTSPPDGSRTPGFQTVPAGEATLGSPVSEPCRVTLNEDQRTVLLSRAFEIGETEVSEGDYQRRVPTARTPIVDCGPDCPANLVSWHESAAYCNALSREYGFDECYTCNGSEGETQCDPRAPYDDEAIYSCPGFRLPTEVEWEIAYRAGTTTMTPDGNFDSSACGECAPDVEGIDEAVVSCHNSAVDRTRCRDLSFFGGPSCAGRQPVASGTPNDFGLYDMGGNLDEWCHDEYVMTTTTLPERDPVGVFDPEVSFTPIRVVRGGNWSVTRNMARAASRAGANALQRLEERGFRCARSLL